MSTLKLFSKIVSLDMTLTLVRGSGQLSTLALRLASLSFSDQLEIETALPEIETDLPEIATALSEIETDLPEIKTLCLKLRPNCLKSRITNINLMKD